MISPVLKSILLVDDDEISNLFNKIFISKLDLGVKVYIALNGKDALESVLGAGADINLPLLTPCLLLLDIRMPIMDGWEFLKRYEKQVDDKTKKAVVIIMLTTSEDEGDMIKAMKNPNIKEVIRKPLSEKKLKTLINKHFVGQQAL